MICDDCGKETKTYEVAGMELCLDCIYPPDEEITDGVMFDGTRVFAIVNGRAYEIVPDFK